jgi:hypothetical protein
MKPQPLASVCANISTIQKDTCFRYYQRYCAPAKQKQVSRRTKAFSKKARVNLRNLEIKRFRFNWIEMLLKSNGF